MAYLKLFKIYWLYAADKRLQIVGYIFCHIFATMALLSIPLIFAQILNTLQLSETDEIIQNISIWIFFWITSFILFNIFHRIGRFFEFKIAYRVKKNFILSYYNRLVSLPLDWHSEHHSGDKINRVNLAARALFNFGIIQFSLIELFFTIVFSILILVYLSFQVSIIAAIIAAITIFTILKFDKYLVHHYRQVNDIDHRISSTFFDFINNINTLITLKAGEKTRMVLDKEIESGYSPMMKAETNLNQWKWFFVSLAMLIQQISLVMYYIWLQISNNSQILIGNVTAVFQYSKMLNESFANIARKYQNILEWETHVDAVSIIPSINVLNSEGIVSDTKFEKIKIDNLNFKYPDKKYELENFSLSFKNGEKIALVGKSGSGKSTLLALIKGIYSPIQSSLIIDEQKFENLALLNNITSLIPQAPEIFDNTIEFNITLGIDYINSDIDEVIELTCLKEVIEKSPGSLNCVVGEKGVSLSGGERQRLALARGLLSAKSSSILLLDEPTSSLDKYNETKIYKNILQYFKDKTIIASVHNPDLLKNFDRIIVLEEGKIIQEGNFEDLLLKEGYFKNLLYKENSKIFS